MFKKILLLTIISLGLTQLVNGQAQIETKAPDEWERVKHDTTYVIMDSVDDARNDIYKKVFTDNWKLTHIEFIDAADFDRNLTPNGSYFSVVYPVTDPTLGLTSTKYNPGIPDAANELMMASEEVYNGMTWKLWTCSDRYFKKQNKFTLSFVKELASIKLYADLVGINLADKQKQSVAKADAKTYAQKMQDAGGSVSGPYIEGTNAFIFNWGPGILKNYLQLFTSMLSNGQSGGLVINSDSVKKIKSDTLFVPDYVLHYPGGSTKYKDRKADELFADYKQPYAVITMDELNNRILNTKTNFFYLLYIKNTSPSVYVINGLTGEVIYDKKIAGEELAADDIAKISKLVSKK